MMREERSFIKLIEDKICLLFALAIPGRAWKELRRKIITPLRQDDAQGFGSLDYTAGT